MGLHYLDSSSKEEKDAQETKEIFFPQKKCIWMNTGNV